MDDAVKLKDYDPELGDFIHVAAGSLIRVTRQISGNAGLIEEAILTCALVNVMHKNSDGDLEAFRRSRQTLNLNLNQADKALQQ